MTTKRPPALRTTTTKGKRAPETRARGPNDAHARRQALGDLVLQRMAEGLSAVKACEEVGLAWGTFWERIASDDDFAGRYTRARELLLERMSDEIHAIANTPVEGETTIVKADGSIEVKRGDMLEHRRLQIESRKWLLAKLMPKKYGDLRHVEHSGRVGLEQLVAGDDDASA